jgi:hypothetical protein
MARAEPVGGLAAPHLRPPVAVVPPFWHHHPEMVWELSALHLHWLVPTTPSRTPPRRSAGTATSPTPESASATGSPPAALASTETARPGSRWPGEDPAPTIQDFTFTDRDTEFVSSSSRKSASARRPKTSSTPASTTTKRP